MLVILKGLDQGASKLGVMRFLGIDLGWTSGASGLCCLELSQSSLSLLDLQRYQSLDEIVAWVNHWAPNPESAMVAVDAPTIITNATGTRPCDRLTHQYFRQYHAGAYPANLGRPFAQHTVHVGNTLEALGFHHAPTMEPQKLGRYQIEMFPHPAMVHLFGLPKILKYKKGKVGERRVELMRLRQLIQQHLPALNPSLVLPEEGVDQPGVINLPAIPAGGAALKAAEDQLDSLICAYAGAHWWYWGAARNLVLGDRATGYIVVPTPNGLPQLV